MPCCRWKTCGRPPTVNSLATLLAHAMQRPWTEGDRQRPSTIYLRDRPQWQELLPHLRQLGIEVVLSDDLPRFDEAVMDWMQKTTKPYFQDEIKVAFRKPFPERRPSCFTNAIALMEWTDAMLKAAYPSRKVAVPAYDPMTVVPIPLATDELEAILTNTTIAKTKKLRPRLEAMAAEDKAIDLDINDWSTVLLALCGPKRDEESGLGSTCLGLLPESPIDLAGALGIDGPPLPVKREPHSAIPMPETLKGLIERVTYHNPENAFAVLKVSGQGSSGLVTVVGSTTAVSAGEHVEGHSADGSSTGNTATVQG